MGVQEMTYLVARIPRGLRLGEESPLRCKVSLEGLETTPDPN